MSVYYIVNGVKVDPTGNPIAEEAVEESKGSGTPLPEEFPGRDDLIAAKFDTVEAVKAVDDLTTVEGIGKATAAKIVEALEAL